MIKQTIQLFALPLGAQLAPSEWDAFLKAPFRSSKKSSAIQALARSAKSDAR